MKVMMTRTKIKADKFAEVNAAGDRVIAALEREQPQNIRYAVCELPDGEGFLTFVAIEEGTDDPLKALPEYQEFAANFKSWLAEMPIAEKATVIRSYRLF